VGGFRANDEVLWSQLRLSIGNFIVDLAQQGAFYQYFVSCDGTTTTQDDINQGIVNVLVGFAPLSDGDRGYSDPAMGWAVLVRAPGAKPGGKAEAMPHENQVKWAAPPDNLGFA